MRMFWLSIVVFIATAACGAPGAIAQCACLPIYVNITPHNEYKLAHVVLIGEILEIKKTDEDQKTGHYTEIITLAVKKVWKRDLESVVTIRQRVDGCTRGFKEKEEWLLYVYKNEAGFLVVHCCCTRTRRLSEANEDLKEFSDKSEMPARILKHPIQG